MDYYYLDKKKFLLENYLKLGLTEQQLIIILLCMSEELTFAIDYDKLQNCMSLETDGVTKILANLFSNNLLSVALEKYGDDYREVVDISKLFSLDLNNSEPEVNVFADIEHIYGKSLSSKEVDVISKWISVNKYKKEDILEAFGIASINNVRNLNYIEKILENNSEKNERVAPIVMQYNWLDED